jgi:hypothetical protein
VKARLSQSGDEQLVDDPVTCEANTALRLACRMRRHHDAATHPLRSHSHLWAVVELAHQGAFWARELPISRQVQAALDLGLIQHGVVLASRHETVASQLSEHGSRAWLSIQPEQRTLIWEVMGSKIPLESLDGLAQFLAIVAVALIAETAEICGIDPRCPWKRQRNERQIHISGDKWELF